ncbi:hypothetical protein [Rhizobium sp. BK008]|uniref:hypothetical protein n=1 Tax=Rhizobium sp. BK008 TaxID=2587094 RepID=UPI00161F7177|nr:hypothetical protein [Rhizobium sp. BK008]MBB4252084.1 hypothetical protein [Rhizobium sp. BK008]
MKNDRAFLQLLAKGFDTNDDGRSRRRTIGFESPFGTDISPFFKVFLPRNFKGCQFCSMASMKLDHFERQGTEQRSGTVAFETVLSEMIAQG